MGETCSEIVGKVADEPFLRDVPKEVEASLDAQRLYDGAEMKRLLYRPDSDFSADEPPSHEEIKLVERHVRTRAMRRRSDQLLEILGDEEVPTTGRLMAGGLLLGYFYDYRAASMVDALVTDRVLQVESDLTTRPNGQAGASYEMGAWLQILVGQAYLHIDKPSTAIDLLYVFIPESALPAEVMERVGWHYKELDVHRAKAQSLGEVRRGRMEEAVETTKRAIIRATADLLEKKKAYFEGMTLAKDDAKVFEMSLEQLREHFDGLVPTPAPAAAGFLAVGDSVEELPPRANLFQQQHATSQAA